MKKITKDDKNINVIKEFVLAKKELDKAKARFEQAREGLLPVFTKYKDNKIQAGKFTITKSIGTYFRFDYLLLKQKLDGNILKKIIKVDVDNTKIKQLLEDGEITNKDLQGAYEEAERETIKLKEAK